ncbi:hypothetical protein HMPREF9129_0255 [Peptoniphilus indolicus ATCC 29427]|uniref:Uncharacterized protein n=1 Tax=Peptoniphilus indolicus ATCC 29427 TaxID=997350 RepID=G4D1H5_9FIRM|nr:hypothetical protein HMPREF9129_0255 [Peptoniphilus indolicus ATCC 29427]
MTPSLYRFGVFILNLWIFYRLNRYKIKLLTKFFMNYIIHNNYNFKF